MRGAGDGGVRVRIGFERCHIKPNPRAGKGSLNLSVGKASSNARNGVREKRRERRVLERKKKGTVEEKER